jgi:hypothetical protein
VTRKQDLKWDNRNHKPGKAHTNDRFIQTITTSGMTIGCIFSDIRLTLCNGCAFLNSAICVRKRIKIAKVRNNGYRFRPNIMDYAKRSMNAANSTDPLLRNPIQKYVNQPMRVNSNVTKEKIIFCVLYLFRNMFQFKPILKQSMSMSTFFKIECDQSKLSRCFKKSTTTRLTRPLDVQCAPFHQLILVQLDREQMEHLGWDVMIIHRKRGRSVPNRVRSNGSA